MKRKIAYLSKFFLLCVSFGLIILFPELCIKSATDGISTCLNIIFPSLFPFMVLSKYLIYSGYGNRISRFFSFLSKIFRINNSGSVAFVMGTFCGSPVGASLVCDMVKTGNLTKKQGEHILGYCNNCGPLFLTGTVGTVLFSDKRIGWFLCVIHILSAFLTGILVRNKKYEVNGRTAVIPSDHAPFVNAVNDSVSAIMGIFGFVIIFSVICGFFIAFSPLKSDILTTLFCGILEISCGCIYISSLHLALPLKLCLISLICGFGGLCILFQTIFITKKTGLSVMPCLKTKFLFSIVSFALCFLSCTIFALFNITFF